MEYIYIDGAQKPKGHYTPAIKSGGMIYVSGQVPTNPFTGERCQGTIEEQTRQSLSNVKVILESAKSCMEKVVKVNIYVADIAYWDAVNSVYQEFFPQHKPARIVVPTTQLHYGVLVEIDCIAEA